jgi:hypothetical protein
VLGDVQKRKEYDRLKHAPVRPDGMPEGFDPDAFARTFGGARATAGGVEFSGDFDVADIFASLFGGAAAARHASWGGRVRPRQSRGADVIGQLPVTFAEAALGPSAPSGPAAAHRRDLGPAGVETAAGCASRARARPRRRRAACPATFTWTWTSARPAPARAGDDIELDLP